MNIRIPISALLLLLVSQLVLAAVPGVLPPEYLRVPQWQKCVDKIACSNAKYLCLPKVKPSDCPLESWEQLTSKHLIPYCSEGCNRFLQKH